MGNGHAVDFTTPGKWRAVLLSAARPLDAAQDDGQTDAEGRGERVADNHRRVADAGLDVGDGGAAQARRLREHLLRQSLGEPHPLQLGDEREREGLGRGDFQALPFLWRRANRLGYHSILLA